MPWFYCDACGDSIKKPKLHAHLHQCYTSGFTCIDCSRTFDTTSVHSHTSCVTEHDKYAKGATKPGGFAAKGFYSGDGGKEDAGPSGEIVGEAWLSTRPPWRCDACNVACTSRATLESHASGAKHVRRVRAKQRAGGAGGGDAGREEREEKEKEEKKEKLEEEKKEEEQWEEENLLLLLLLLLFFFLFFFRFKHWES